MKNQRFLSALAATVMAVSLFTCTAPVSYTHLTLPTNSIV